MTNLSANDKSAAVNCRADMKECDSTEVIGDFIVT